jgi:hypothetical protein
MYTAVCELFLSAIYTFSLLISQRAIFIINLILKFFGQSDFFWGKHMCLKCLTVATPLKFQGEQVFHMEVMMYLYSTHYIF